ncbi:hypothetical protein ALC152_02660 [Arcobacter sp. 15-2]
MEDKVLKNSFALLTTLLLVLLFSVLSIRFIEVNLLSSNLNRLKYLHLQAIIYKDTIESYILTHNQMEIEQYKQDWNDATYTMDIIVDENNSSIYYLNIATKNNYHIRLSQKIEK